MINNEISVSSGAAFAESVDEGKAQACPLMPAKAGIQASSRFHRARLPLSRQ
jgi:hypothetical protein